MIKIIDEINYLNEDSLDSTFNGNKVINQQVKLLCERLIKKLDNIECKNKSATIKIQANLNLDTKAKIKFIIVDCDDDSFVKEIQSILNQ